MHPSAVLSLQTGSLEKAVWMMHVIMPHWLGSGLQPHVFTAAQWVYCKMFAHIASMKKPKIATLC